MRADRILGLDTLSRQQARSQEENIADWAGYANVGIIDFVMCGLSTFGVSA